MALPVTDKNKSAWATRLERKIKLGVREEVERVRNITYR